MCDILAHKPRIEEILETFKEVMMVKPVTVSMNDLAEMAVLELGSKLGIHCPDDCFRQTAKDWALHCLRTAYTEALAKGPYPSEVHAYLRNNFPGFGQEGVGIVNQWLFEDGLNGSPHKAGQLEPCA